jgi:lysophospholipase L1-like esterase
VNNKKQVIITFFIGLIAALLMLEIGLRIAGGIFRNGRIPDAIMPSNKEGKQYTILCLGNSFTVGVGAPKGLDYPGQLQQLFDKETPANKVRVINGGVGNQNTSELLSKLEYNIIRWDPDLIVIQTGQPNLWNHYKFRMYLERKSNPGMSFRKAVFYLNDFLYSSRVYRLAVLLINATKERYTKQNQKVEEPDSDYLEAMDWMQQIKLHKEIHPFDQEKADKVVNSLKKRIAAYPNEVDNYRNIGAIYFYQNKHMEAAQWFIKGIKVNPGYRKGVDNRNYASLRRLYIKTGDEEVKRMIERFTADFNKSNPGYSDNLLILRYQEIYNWIESDIREIIRAIQNKRIKVLLQNYPPSINNETTIYFNKFLLPEIAREFNIPFVDNNEIFHEIMDKDTMRRVFFIGDGHCNARGYGVMAMNVFRKIKEENTNNRE